MDFMDIFNDDAFSLISLTAAINEEEHVPGRAGLLTFAGAGEGVSTETVVIERKGEVLSLIQTSARGGSAPQGGDEDKANLRSVLIPHIKKEDSVNASQVAGVREFGTTDVLRSVQSVVNGKLAKLTREHDLTLEHHQLGAIKGLIKDADGSSLTDLFELFGVTNDNTDAGGGANDVGPRIFDFDLDQLASEPVDIRIKCQAVSRYIVRRAGMVVPSTARVWAFAGDNFFDKLISREDVKKTYLNTDEQRVRLGSNYAFGVFEYGGIVWENYRGTNDGTTVAIDPDEARLFLTGVPGLYAEYYAPGDFMETVNTLGLPRYAKLAPDRDYNRFVKVHTQQNPLPLCLRPQTLCKAV